MIAAIFFAAALAAAQPQVPGWAGLPARAVTLMQAEGIGEPQYERLARGGIETERRPVPLGMSGVHLAAFGIVRAPAEKLWDAIADCDRLHEFMPHVEACVPVRSDRALPPGERWDELKLQYNMLFCSKTVRVVNDTTLKAPNYLSWKMVRGDEKENQGYYRIITLAPGVQLLVYDTINDPGIPAPKCIEQEFIRNSLPEIVEAIRRRVETPAPPGRTVICPSGGPSR